MEKEFVTYKIASKLKKLGFDEECLAKYCRYNPNDEIKLFPHTQDFFKGYFYSCNNSDYGKEKIATPLWQQAISWLREKHNIIVMVLDKGYDSSIYYLYTINGKWHPSQIASSTYEEALEAGLFKALKLIKEK